MKKVIWVTRFVLNLAIIFTMKLGTPMEFDSMKLVQYWMIMQVALLLVRGFKSMLHWLGSRLYFRVEVTMSMNFIVNVIHYDFTLLYSLPNS